MNSIYLYPWDALDAGVPALLDRLSEAGLNRIKVALVYHTGKLLLAGNPARRVFFPEDGALNYRPAESFYRESPLHPPVSRIARSADPLEELLGEAEPRGIEVNAWIVCLHNRAIASVCPDVCTVNAYGVSYPHSLCPMHDDVQQYLQALIRDLTARGVRRVVLEAIGFVPFHHYSYCQVEGVEVGPEENLLLSLCFCDACQRSFDAAASVRRFAREQLDAFFRTGEPSAARIAGTDVAALLSGRAEAIKNLVQLLSTAASNPGGTVSVIASGGARDALTGIDLEQVGPAAAAIDFAYYRADASQLSSQLAEVQAVLPATCALDLLLRPGYPDIASESDLREKLEIAAGAGVRDFSFYNYGLLPEAGFARLAAVTKPSSLHQQIECGN